VQLSSDLPVVPKTTSGFAGAQSTERRAHFLQMSERKPS